LAFTYQKCRRHTNHADLSGSSTGSSTGASSSSSSGSSKRASKGVSKRQKTAVFSDDEDFE
jgi:hypothetical protein